MKIRKLFIFLLSFLFFSPVYAQIRTDRLYSEKLKKKCGKVSTIEKDYIFINLGRSDGISAGMVFKVFDQENNFIDRLEIKEVIGNNISVTVLLEKDRRFRRGGRRKEVEAGHLVELEMEELSRLSNEEEEIQIRRLKDRDWQVRVNAVDILAKSGGFDVIPEILLVLDENWDPKIIKLLSKAEQNARINLRRSAAWALGEISFRVFSEIFLESKNEPVLDKEKKEILNKITNVLVKLSSDLDNTVCLEAVRNITRLIAIRQIFGLETDFLLDPLGKILIEEKDSYVKRAVIEALAELQDVNIIPVLLTAWDDKDSAVRANISWALEKIGRPALPLLKEMLNDPNEEKRRESVRVLYKLGYQIKKIGDKYEIVE